MGLSEQAKTLVEEAVLKVRSKVGWVPRVTRFRSNRVTVKERKDIVYCAVIFYRKYIYTVTILAGLGHFHTDCTLWGRLVFGKIQERLGLGLGLGLEG